ncbi:MAG: LysR family transcriptional regulator [Rhizobiales bacterium]|nr:LysR family transcriptional regulator [Hyphomicrobiales bacterium]
MMLHARLLRYLDEVARSGSIRKAAAKLNVASSAVNRQIIAFEDEVGTPLFERLPHGLRLTAAGEIIIAHVRKTLKDYKWSSERIDRLRDYRFPSASIATVGGLACDVLAKALMELRAERPFIRLMVSVMDADDIMGVVAAGDFDLGFAFDLPDFGGVTRASSLETRYGAVMLPSHPLAGEPALRLNTLRDYPLIAPRVGVLIRDQFDDACQRNDIQIQPVIESDSFEFLKQFAASNQGIALLNELDIDAPLRSGALVFVPIVELKGKTQTISVVHRTRGALAPLPGLVVERLSDLLEARRGSG